MHSRGKLRLCAACASGAILKQRWITHDSYHKPKTARILRRAPVCTAAARARLGLPHRYSLFLIYSCENQTKIYSSSKLARFRHGPAIPPSVQIYTLLGPLYIVYYIHPYVYIHSDVALVSRALASVRKSSRGSSRYKYVIRAYIRPSPAHWLACFLPSFFHLHSLVFIFIYFFFCSDCGGGSSSARVARART